MSIFNLNGPKKIVANEDIQITEESRYFFPGLIHGCEDYIIQVYGWSVGDRPEDKRAEVKYLYAEDIMELAKKYTKRDGSLHEKGFKESFEMLEGDAETFFVKNNGQGDYYILNQMWGKAEPEDYGKLVKWAMKACTKLFGASAYVDLVEGKLKCKIEEISVVGMRTNCSKCQIIYLKEPTYISKDYSTHCLKESYLDKRLQITDNLSVFYSTSAEACKKWLESYKTHLEETTEKTYKTFKKTYDLIKNAVIEYEGDNQDMDIDTQLSDKKPSDAEVDALVQKVDERLREIEDCAVPDKLLAEMVRNNDFSYPGFADDIFHIYKQSQDKAAFRYLFFEFTGKEFEEYLQKCIKEMEE